MLRVITLTAILPIALSAIALRGAALDQDGSKSYGQEFGEASTMSFRPAFVPSSSRRALSGSADSPEARTG